jgi:hypothetical protein
MDSTDPQGATVVRNLEARTSDGCRVTALDANSRRLAQVGPEEFAKLAGCRDSRVMGDIAAVETAW